MVEKDTLPFWPYFVIKDLFALAVILAIFFAVVGFMPNYLGHPDNYIEANPLVTPCAYRAGMVLPAVLRHPARLHLRGLGGAMFASAGSPAASSMPSSSACWPCSARSS